MITTGNACVNFIDTHSGKLDPRSILVESKILNASQITRHLRIRGYCIQPPSFLFGSYYRFIYIFHFFIFFHLFSSFFITSFRITPHPVSLMCEDYALGTSAAVIRIRSFFLFIFFLLPLPSSSFLLSFLLSSPVLPLLPLLPLLIQSQG